MLYWSLLISLNFVHSLGISPCIKSFWDWWCHFFFLPGLVCLWKSISVFPFKPEGRTVSQNLGTYLLVACSSVFWVKKWAHILFFFFTLFIYLLKFFFFICGGFCHTLKWNSHGFTCVPHPDPPSHLPLHPLPLGLPSAPGPSACLMHPTWAGDLFHPR